jgi:hypothetical protein
MPTVYERDDERRLITVVITDPYTVGDMLNAIERQMAENTWEYAMLWDMRATARMATVHEAPLITNRVQSLSGHRKRGPVAMEISGIPAQVRAGVEFASSNRRIAIPEIVLTAPQLSDWLARHAPSRKAEGF